MTQCPECEKQAIANENIKLEQVFQKSLPQAIAEGHTSFALIPTINPNPGYMWRPIGHPDIERIGSPHYYTIY